MSTYKDIYVVINSERRVLSCCRSCNRLVIPKNLQATDAVRGYDKVEKTFWFHSNLEYIAFTTVKLDSSSKLSMLKGYNLSIEGTRKGYLFCPTWYI